MDDNDANEKQSEKMIFLIKSSELSNPSNKRQVTPVSGSSIPKWYGKFSLNLTEYSNPSLIYPQ